MNDDAPLYMFAAEKRAVGTPWPHIANMAGCPIDTLRPYMGVLKFRRPASTPAPAAPVVPAAPRPTESAEVVTGKVQERKTTTTRREPGGLACAVLLLVGDGYRTSLAIARVLDTSIDNVNGALGRLERGGGIRRRHRSSPVLWEITETGKIQVRDEGNWL